MPRAMHTHSRLSHILAMDLQMLVAATSNLQ